LVVLPPVTGRAVAEAEGTGRVDAAAEAEGATVTHVVLAVGGLGYIVVPAGHLVEQYPLYGKEPGGHVATQLVTPIWDTNM
jgi:hypothetical protein